MSRIVTGQGTVFYRQSQRVTNIISIEHSGKVREVVQVKHDIDGYKRYLSTLRDSGSITLSMLFDRAIFDLFEEDFNNNKPQQYSIHFPDDANTVWTFRGLVTELPVSVQVNDVLAMEVVIKISGKIIITGQSSSSSSSSS